MSSLEQQIHVERLVHAILSDLDELLSIRNSANADLLTAEAGNISAIYARAATLASHLREVARAA